ncbi:UNVERIFIED_CONTAM: Callose synthase 10 [Sesamum calycinum]|uniref:1,3-beta-glucan synthase n=1 Tax=Sesamum calycinum TaxID=2727403 RepID=A0AAW2NGJ9_9LAMI
MARVYDNWERLVKAVLRSEQRGGHQRTPSGIAGAVPDSLQRTTNINAILQAADEIQSEDPNVARILCEQAYSMAQNLDPNSDGRGVLQFKTGLMSVIKEASKNNNGKAAHSEWRNYDDFNEYFWSPACFELGWPMKKDSSFLLKPKKGKRIYLMDIHIWYTLLSAIYGAVMGARARLGEIRSVEMVHKRFESFPEAFVKNLVSPQIKNVFTPYYSETVLYSNSELRVENEDGISILFYLQKIFPGMLLVLKSDSGDPFYLHSKNVIKVEDVCEGMKWENFLQRIGHGDGGDAEFHETSTNALELRFWASYRGQTLARTVRGMMYYRRALMLQSYLERRSLEEDVSYHTSFTTQGFELSREARAQADIKFTYVVSCQIYGQQKQRKAPEAADIALLLQRNEALRVAFIHVEESGAADGKVTKEFYSKLVKADEHGKDQEIFSIKLPGDPKLGEGKPENQNHAIIFTRGEAVQTIDMNQDNYLEEAMKMRNLLEEFRGNHGLRPPTILGVREHVFTGSVSSLAWFMSNQETSFVTLGQRVLAKPLKVRMHYGHPDVFDRIFHVTRGGISKASRVINISEDIYAGFNSTLRQGNITHHEYIQVGKGRDVGLNQIALFEGKVAGGNGEQVLSRDVYRLGQLFDFFRMLSFFFTTVGYYVCTMAFSGLDKGISREAKLLGNTAFDAVLNAQFLVQIGVFTAVPMIMGFILELGLLQVCSDTVYGPPRMIRQHMYGYCSAVNRASALFSLLYIFIGDKNSLFWAYYSPWRCQVSSNWKGFCCSSHIKFAENYRLYSRSHFVKALEVALLLIVCIAYGYSEGGAVSFILLTISSWFLVISWLFAPYIFNPSGFEWQNCDLCGTACWPMRNNVYLKRMWILKSQMVVYGFSWVVLVGIVLIFKIFTFSPKKSTNFQLMLRFIQGATAIGLIVALCLVVLFTSLTVADLFASILAFIPTGWLILSPADFESCGWA